MKKLSQLELLIRIDERLKGVEWKIRMLIPIVLFILVSEFDKFRPLLEGFVKVAFAQ